MAKEKKPSKSTLGTFVATVSHDLRSPLTAIHLSAALILQEAQQSPSGERIRYRVAVIQRQVSAMVRMIDSLLDAEKINVGKLPINKKEVDATEDVLEILDEFIPIASACKILIDVIIPERPLPACYDRDRIRQVLGNLVSNALKYSKKESTCTILVRRDDNPDWIRFEVKNVGPVIPEDRRESIFNKFERGENQDGSSSGLGLWIAKWIVKEHGGRIWVEPVEAGNRFCFTLPKGYVSSSSC